MAKIMGTELRKFRLGYLTSNFTRIGRFTPEDLDGAGFGQLLKYGSATGQYDVTDGSETSAREIAGVSVYPQVKGPNAYPGGPTKIRHGEYGDVLEAGDIVVELSPLTGDVDNAVEGANVYLATDGKVTPDADDGESSPTNFLLLPQFVFLGLTEVDENGKTLVAVRKLY